VNRRESGFPRLKRRVSGGKIGSSRSPPNENWRSQQMPRMPYRPDKDPQGTLADAAVPYIAAIVVLGLIVILVVIAVR
jgi:hypothetical protein